MSVKLIKKDVYSVGVVDWNKRHFHKYEYKTRRGITYNSYLIIDEKITLIDTVSNGFENEFIENINSIIKISKVDIIVINHTEPDHSGVFKKILTLCPNAKIYGTEKARLSLIKYYGCIGNWFTVQAGMNLKIGKRTLTFLSTPMIHWPDNMFTYSYYDRILFSNDGFGQHYATDKLFDIEVDYNILMNEAKNYYANILWPFNSLIKAKLSILETFKIDIIAPSHGLIWYKYIDDIMKKYLFWSSDKCHNKITVVYETMWYSTEKIAKSIVNGIVETKKTKLNLFDITKNDTTDILSSMLDSKGWVLGSSTCNRNILPSMLELLFFLKETDSKNRLSLLFGSYGWSGEAVKNIENMLLKNIVLYSSVNIVFKPNKKELEECNKLGKLFAINISKLKY
ncbi:MAG: FprA family A-type flavoprotein [Endomicrobium sp.]|nr:FprA family A-type flavoprotein [Endomicrobium sp.]